MEVFVTITLPENVLVPLNKLSSPHAASVMLLLLDGKDIALPFRNIVPPPDNEDVADIESVPLPVRVIGENVDVLIAPLVVLICRK